MDYLTTHRKLSSDVAALDDFIIGSSEPINKVKDLIRLCAPTDSPVLILAETGCGKELAARALHALSLRSDNDLIAANCGAFPESLVDSELFGHVRGAFTGAVADRKGKFELANKGTIFLDEIGETSHQIQVKFLRALESGEIEKVGGERPSQVDVRVLAATNVDLETARSTGRFRTDLFFRLNHLVIRIPPLRERKEDIPMLIDHFLVNHRSPDGRMVRISTSALDLLYEYSFPGNVRELMNMVEGASILAGWGEITEEHLPEDVRKGSGPGPVAPRSRVRCEALLKALYDIVVPCKGGRIRPLHRVLRGTSIDNIHAFLVHTDEMGFSPRKFAEHLSLSKNGKGAIQTYTSGLRYLGILKNNGILKHNGRKANAARYMLSDEFLEES
jgi:transcriptional regulator with GAF, ATPase, and Fis domain